MSVERVSYEELTWEIRETPYIGASQGRVHEQQSRYSALGPNTIRLVDLTGRTYPGFEGTSRIPTCSLRTHSIASSPGSDPLYTAISYTWIAEEYSWYGEKLPKSTKILVGNRVVLVPSQVALILGYVFNMGIETIWIDCLSINQNDLVERGHQVAQMNEIFHRATQVLVFLGKPSSNIDRTLWDMFSVGDDMANPDNIDRPYMDRVGLREILNHRYWHRAWILQEIGLSRSLRIACGTYVLDSKQSNSLLHRLINFEKSSDLKQHLSLINRITVGGRPPLLGTVIATRYSGCSEPRDALYAKMHLAKDGGMLGQPDYTKSIASLFHQFAVACVATSHSLRVLSFAGGYNNALGMPTWVPDWTPRDQMPEMRLGSLSSYDALLKDPMRQCTAWFEEDSTILVVRGWILKTMTHFRQSVDPLTFERDLRLSDNGENLSDSLCERDELFLCLIFGCITTLVLSRRGHNYVIVNFASSHALQQRAQAEADGISLANIIPEYPITEFRIA